MDNKTVTIKIKKKVNGKDIIVEVRILIEYENIVGMYQAKSELKQETANFVDRHLKEIYYLNGSIYEYFIEYLNEKTNVNVKDVDISCYPDKEKVKEHEMEM